MSALDRELLVLHGLTTCRRDAEKVAEAAAELVALRAELEQCRADADRYRYLRAEHQRIDPVCHLTWKVGMCREGSVWANTTDLDAAIDAARGAK